MSFVENNKAWLLPLLGLGVAAVAYMNFRSPAPAPSPAKAVAAEIPSGPVMPAAPPPPPAPGSPVAGTAGDLWGDLKALAKPPSSILAEAGLRERCRENLDPLLVDRAPVRLPRPGAVRLATPYPVAAPSYEPIAQPPPPPVPELGFILSSPQGLRAWFQGQPYREGQSLPGGAYRVDSIRWDHVNLIGPSGKTALQPTHRPLAGSRPSMEAP